MKRIAAIIAIVLFLATPATALNNLPQTFPIQVAPIVGGALQQTTQFNYSWSFTNDLSCTDLITLNATVTTNAQGYAYMELNITNLTTTPAYLCEVRNGALQTIHRLNPNQFGQANDTTLNATIDARIGFGQNDTLQSVTNRGQTTTHGMSILGATDEPQFIIAPTVAQTEYLVQINNSAGERIWTIDAAGNTQFWQPSTGPIAFTVDEYADGVAGETNTFEINSSPTKPSNIYNLNSSPTKLSNLLNFSGEVDQGSCYVNILCNSICLNQLCPRSCWSQLCGAGKRRCIAPSCTYTTQAACEAAAGCAWSSSVVHGEINIQTDDGTDCALQTDDGTDLKLLQGDDGSLHERLYQDGVLQATYTRDDLGYSIADAGFKTVGDETILSTTGVTSAAGTASFAAYTTPGGILYMDESYFDFAAQFYVDVTSTYFDYAQPYGASTSVNFISSSPGPQIIIDNNWNSLDQVQLVLRDSASQTANALEIRDSADAVLAYIDPTGTFYDASGQVCTATNGLCTTDLSSVVPYTGATGPVDLGVNDLLINASSVCTAANGLCGSTDTGIGNWSGNYTYVESLGNWTGNSSSYSTTTAANLLYAPIGVGNWAGNASSYALNTYAASIGNWSGNVSIVWTNDSLLNTTKTGTGTTAACAAGNHVANITGNSTGLYATCTADSASVTETDPKWTANFTTTANTSYVSSLGNWSGNQSSYATNAYAASLGNWTGNASTYYKSGSTASLAATNFTANVNLTSANITTSNGGKLIQNSTCIGFKWSDGTVVGAGTGC